ncbi:MAG: hypothetical protein LBQ75_02125, partial [Zoogloeaceae bacterium]|nr:hypothetical protein [Zoogloeaceae bacterium]
CVDLAQYYIISFMRKPLFLLDSRLRGNDGWGDARALNSRQRGNDFCRDAGCVPYEISMRGASFEARGG